MSKRGSVDFTSSLGLICTWRPEPPQKTTNLQLFLFFFSSTAMRAFSKGFCQRPHASRSYFISNRLSWTQQVAPPLAERLNDVSLCIMVRCFLPSFYSSKALSEFILHLCCLMLLLSLLLLLLSLLLSPIDCSLAYTCWLDPFLI